MRLRAALSMGVLLLILVGCVPAQPAPGFSVSPPPPARTMPGVTPSATVQTAGVWIEPAVPDALRRIALAGGIPPAADAAHAAIRLELARPGEPPAQSQWFYALVAPFPTVVDAVTFADLKKAWLGSPHATFGDRPLLMSASTLEALKPVFGADPAPGAVRLVAPDQLSAALWQDRPQWGIAPFETLDPKVKVLAVDGQSPIRKDFDAALYPLHAGFSLQPSSTIPLPATNRDASKLTTVIMSGTSALVRAIAFKMEQNGLLYPDGDVRDLLRQADILHISNEVSFADTCPPPSYDTHDLRFCSNTKYLALLEDIGVDVVEVTGNHINNWDVGPLRDTLNLYKTHGWLYFGGGMNLADAEKPALITHHGTRLAFLGCNVPGPEPAFATATLPGAAPCGNYGWLLDEIHSLRAQGYQVIVTQQYEEYYIPNPTENQARDFNRLAEAGATIVSGSQAHFPQTIAFVAGAFVHYGLGNLFFDQMSYQFPDTGQFTYKTRDGFLDRHVFYDGKYVGTELLTVILEDHSRPRPMTPDERSAFLAEYFTASGW
jgi:hypothetical protein